MRLCRYQHNGNVDIGYYTEEGLVPLARLAAHRGVRLARLSEHLVDYLPPEGAHFSLAKDLWIAFEKLPAEQRRHLTQPFAGVKLRAPVPRPGKIFLLAGNYAAHVRESGKKPPNRQDSYPYFFMKPQTAVNHPGEPIVLLRISPHHIT